MEQAKHLGRGRPTLYDPAYCEKVIEFGRLGKSRTWIAAEIGVSRDTLYEWEGQHQDFSDAITRARDLAQRWWEDVGQDNLLTAGFQSSAWSRSMAARFPQDWREKSETKHVGAGDGPLQVEYTTSEIAMATLTKLLGMIEGS